MRRWFLFSQLLLLPAARPLFVSFDTVLLETIQEAFFCTDALEKVAYEQHCPRQGFEQIVPEFDARVHGFFL